MSRKTIRQPSRQLAGNWREGWRVATRVIVATSEKMSDLPASSAEASRGGWSSGGRQRPHVQPVLPLEHQAQALRGPLHGPQAEAGVGALGFDVLDRHAIAPQQVPDELLAGPLRLAAQALLG